MPKKAVSGEEKEKAFLAWKESDEYKAIMKFNEVRQKDEDIDKIDNAYKDIW